MNTYFVRHNTGLAIDDETRRRLWRERRIAIHFRNCSSFNPDDYSGSGKSCMRRLTELAGEGGYVCAEHHLHPKLMIGFVRPHSKIELLKGKCREEEKGTAFLKTLHLNKVKLVDPLDYAVLAVGRPRQGTIMRWHLAGKTIENLIEERRSKPRLSDLTPSQQEILCSEFLRFPKATAFGLPRLAHLLLPTGHTMRDIDIVGIAADGKRLLAQVTFSPLQNATWKIENLLPYRNTKEAHLIFFCECAEQSEQKGIIIFPIQRAYEWFVATQLGKVWRRHSA